ncbi:hypothetical protein [Nonomuraea sp. NPDC003709]|uniref:hypothetical protein n=1 Tax=Nonomuraea sp. NPDC003709 TaxID=3154450 RepID=UPI0033AD8995
MTPFLSELGKKLAEKWLSLLVLPGLLYLATIWTGWTLGHQHWYKLDELVKSITNVRNALSAADTATLMVALPALLLLAAGVGILASGAASVVELVWAGLWPRPLAWCERVLFRRNARWLRATRLYEAEVIKNTADQDLSARDRYAARRNRIALAEPTRSTWIGDQYNATETRIRTEYSMDLPSVWPRLWMVIPEEARAELRSARATFDSATSLAGWGVCYLLVGALWWPAALAGILVLAAGWRRGRLAGRLLAFLIESTVDLYGYTLAEQLGLASNDRRFTRSMGESITVMMRKGA